MLSRLKNKFTLYSQFPNFIKQWYLLYLKIKSDNSVVIHPTCFFQILVRILFGPIINSKIFFKPGDQIFSSKLRKMFNYILQKNCNYSNMIKKQIPKELFSNSGSEYFLYEKDILEFDNTEFHLLNIYFKHHFSSLVRFKKKGSVIDLGANVGSFSKAVGNIFENQRIYAFEAHPQIFNQCVQNLKKMPNVFPVNMCIGNKKVKKSQLLFSDKLFTETKVVKKKSEKTIEVKSISLDEYCSSNNITNINFIKFDIEGAERDALIGMLNLLKKYKPALTISAYHMIDDIPVIIKILKKAVPDYNIIVSNDFHIYAF